MCLTGVYPNGTKCFFNHLFAILPAWLGRVYPFDLAVYSSIYRNDADLIMFNDFIWDDVELESDILKLLQ